MNRRPINLNIAVFSPGVRCTCEQDGKGSGSDDMQAPGGINAPGGIHAPDARHAPLASADSQGVTKLRPSLRHAIILFVTLSFLTAMASCASVPNGMAQQWYQIGNSWLDAKDWQKAGDAYSKALAIDPNLLAASYSLARALAESGNYTQALATVNALLVKDPSNVQTLTLKAYIYYKAGDFSSALAGYSRVWQLAPFAPDISYNLALLEFADGHPLIAVARLEPLIRLAPGDGRMNLLIAQCYDKLAQPEKAAAAFQVAADAKAADPKSLRRLGELYEDQKRYANAVEQYKAAIAADPKDAVALFKLAKLQLTVTQESKDGLDNLANALTLGFNDKTLTKALLDEPTLQEREKIIRLLTPYNLAN